MKSCSLLYAKRTSSCRVIVFVWLSSNQKLEVETCFVCNCFALLYSDKICTLHLSGSRNDKIENLPSLLWSFRNCINEILYLAQNMVGYLSRTLYVFSFLRAKLEENSELRRTEDDQGKTSEDTLIAWNGSYFCVSSLKYFWQDVWSFLNFPARTWKYLIDIITRIFPRFSWSIFFHVTRLGQSRGRENISWFIMGNFYKVIGVVGFLLLFYLHERFSGRVP